MIEYSASLFRHCGSCWSKKFLQILVGPGNGRIKAAMDGFMPGLESVGIPRSGPAFDKYRRDKLAYRNGIRNRQRNETSVLYDRL